MALNTTSYCMVSDIERMVGEQARGGRFRNADTELRVAASDPSLAQVEEYINRASDYINARLQIAGYVAPISETNYSFTYSWASEVCAALVSSRILNSQPIKEADVGVGGEDEASSRSESFQGQVSDFFRAMDAGLLIAEKANPTVGRGSVGFPTARTPIFTINQTIES